LEKVVGSSFTVLAAEVPQTIAKVPSSSEVIKVNTELISEYYRNQSPRYVPQKPYEDFLGKITIPGASLPID